MSAVRTDSLHRGVIGLALVAALAGGLVSAAAAQTAAPYVKVLVNGTPVAFDQPPMIANGRVLVPLRGVFERLGAVVSWDAGTETVLARRNTTDVSLMISSPQAFVNGQAQFLDVPPMLVGGRTLVPLRFISQALGAAVSWNPASTTVHVVGIHATATPFPNGAPAAGAAPPANLPSAATHGPAQPQSHAPQTITGTVTQVNAAANPGRLSVQAPGGDVFTYQVTSETAVTRTDAAAGSSPIALSAVAPGDTVTITADPAGTAQTVQDAYTLAQGTVGSIGHDKITLRGGQTYSLSPLVRVTRAGLSVSPEGLQPGDEVTVRISPVTRVAYGIDAAQTGTLPAVSAVTLSPTGRPLVTGDVMTVMATGPVHGTATFSIDGVRRGLPMREFISQPGLYVGTYAIQPGDKLSNSNVVVSITAATGQTLTAAAPTEVSINAATSKGSAGAPVISSPAPGTGIRAPFTVTGTAPPSSLVQVRADYAGTGTAAGLRGTLGTQTVTADARGYWAVTFAARPPVQGTAVTISAVLVDSTGAARTPATTVNTTLE